MDFILVDGDVVKYRCGFAAQKTRYDIWTDEHEKVERCDNAKDANALIAACGEEFYKTPFVEVEPVENALHSVKLMMQSIQEKYPDAEMQVYFSCPTKDNWRTKLYPQYKANRKPRVPEHAEAIRAYMDRKYQVTTLEDMEADDIIAMDAYALRQAGKQIVVATIDKDMDQIPGTHYNFVTQEEYDIDVQSALALLDLQIVAGDAVDNVPGIKGIGMKKAEWLLEKHGDPATVYDYAYASMAASDYWLTLNKALVQLPWSLRERAGLIKDVADARKAFQALQEASPDADDSVEGTGTGDEGVQGAKKECS